MGDVPSRILITIWQRRNSHCCTITIIIDLLIIFCLCKNVSGVCKPHFRVLIDCIDNFERLKPNDSIISIYVDHNLIWITFLIDPEIHISFGSQMLLCSDNFQFIFNTKVVLLQPLNYTIDLLHRRVIINVYNVEVGIIDSFERIKKLLISIFAKKLKTGTINTNWNLFLYVIQFIFLIVIIVLDLSYFLLLMLYNQFDSQTDL